jgi:hypothetical protein
MAKLDDHRVCRHEMKAEPAESGGLPTVRVEVGLAPKARGLRMILTMIFQVTLRASGNVCGSSTDVIQLMR